MTRRVSANLLSRLSHKDQVRFALFCYDQVRHMYVHGLEAIRCHEVIDNWLQDKATDHQCRSAYVYLHTYVLSSNYPKPHPIYTLLDVNMMTYEDDSDEKYYRHYWVADIAEDVTRLSKHPNKTIMQQREYYKELRYIDDIFEKLVLKGK